MIIRKLRLQRGWSQEQLAQFSGLSLRTVQRIERNQSSSLESLKALSAVFEVPIHELQQENTNMHSSNSETKQQEPAGISREEVEVIERVRDLKAFYHHAIVYVCVITGLCILNFVSDPGYFWAKWPAMGWGIGLAIHGMCTLEFINLFGPEWEKKQIEKRLDRKL